MVERINASVVFSDSSVLAELREDESDEEQMSVHHETGKSPVYCISVIMLVF